MSPIDGPSSSPGTLAGNEPAIEIAENIGALSEVSDATAVVARELVAPALTELPAADAPVADAPGPLLLGLRPPLAAMADIDPAAIQGLLQGLADDGATRSHPVTVLRNQFPTMTPAGSTTSRPTDTTDRIALDATKGTLNTLAQLAANPALQVERGGIIASFILNAGMIPQLPRQPLHIGAEQQVSPAALPNPMIEEEEALTYLANLGADQALLEKIRKMMAKKMPAKKLLFGLAALMTALNVVTEALGRELATFTEDWHDNEENRSRAESHGHSGRRRHLYLE